MRALQKFLWSVVPLVLVVTVIYLAMRADGTRQAVSAPVVPAVAEIRMYLQVEGLEGELTDGPHKGCLEVLAYS